MEESDNDGKKDGENKRGKEARQKGNGEEKVRTFKTAGRLLS